MCAVDYRDLSDADLTELETASKAIRECTAAVSTARAACEAAAVIVNPHMALVYL